MKTEIRRGRWWTFKDCVGRIYIPTEDVSTMDDLLARSQGSFVSAYQVAGWGARWVKGLYEDVTDWVVFNEEGQAQRYLQEPPCVAWEDAVRRSHEGSAQSTPPGSNP